MEHAPLQVNIGHRNSSSLIQMMLSMGEEETVSSVNNRTKKEWDSIYEMVMVFSCCFCSLLFFRSVSWIVLVHIIENTPRKYALSYTYVRYIHILLCQNTSSDYPMYLFLDWLKYLISLCAFLRLVVNYMWNLLSRGTSNCGRFSHHKSKTDILIWQEIFITSDLLSKRGAIFDSNYDRFQLNMPNFLRALSFKRTTKW